MASTRREFVTRSAAMLASSTFVRFDGLRPKMAETPIVLFQGDSITDGGRNRSITAANDPAGLGVAYPLQVLQMLVAPKPFLSIKVYNRGVSGNTVADLRDRWQADTLDLKPTILSILIGVNDVWHTIGKTPADEVVATYESGYTALLDRTRAALPDTRIVVLEPFVLRTGAVTDAWFPEFDQLRAACRRVSDHAGAQFIGLHEMFQERAARTSPAYWAADGVHPTAAGHEAIAREWINAIKL